VHCVAVKELCCFHCSVRRDGDGVGPGHEPLHAKLRFMSDQAGLLTSCIFDDDPCILIE
jgi:hypothetical protein